MFFHFQDLVVFFSPLSFFFPPPCLLLDQQSWCALLSVEPPLEEAQLRYCPSPFLIFSGSDKLSLSRCFVFFIKSSALLAGISSGFVLQLLRFRWSSGVNSVRSSWPNSWTLHHGNALYLCWLPYSFYLFFYSVQLLLNLRFYETWERFMWKDAAL